MGKKWIAVDLDGTLAKYQGAMDNAIGEPVLPMLQRVKDWIAAGEDVRLFTARAGDAAQLPHLQNWLNQQGLQQMKITNVKDFDMKVLYDDKAIRVERNKGYICGGCYRMRSGK